MLEASNLGQIVGRLLYGGMASASPRPARRPMVLELVQRLGSVACADLVRELGIDSTHASVLLRNMQKDGLLVRSGERRQYRYSLPLAG